MAVAAARASVTTAATKICENTSAVPASMAATHSYLLIAQAVSGLVEPRVVALGPAGVTSATGARWNLEGKLALDLGPGEALYGIVPAGASAVAIDVLSAGR